MPHLSTLTFQTQNNNNKIMILLLGDFHTFLLTLLLWEFSGTSKQHALVEDFIQSPCKFTFTCDQKTLPHSVLWSLWACWEKKDKKMLWVTIDIHWRNNIIQILGNLSNSREIPFQFQISIEPHFEYQTLYLKSGSLKQIIKSWNFLLMNLFTLWRTQVKLF